MISLWFYYKYIATLQNNSKKGEIKLEKGKGSQAFLCNFLNLIQLNYSLYYRVVCWLVMKKR